MTASTAPRLPRRASTPIMCWRRRRGCCTPSRAAAPVRWRWARISFEGDIMTDAVVVSTARTPIGKAYRGAFNNTHGATLAGHAIAQALVRAKVDPAEIEDVMLGCAMPEGA